MWYMLSSRDGMKICESMIAFFSVLKKLKTDYKLGIVSNFPHKLALLTMLKRFDLSRFFEAIVVSAQLGARKPNPKYSKKR